MQSIINTLLPKTVGLALNGLSFLYPEKAGELSLNLFKKPRDGKINTQDELFLSTCSSTLTIDTPQGYVQSYVWNPTGSKTILLLHGWESNAARWQTIIDQLANNGFKIIAIDAPAHGNSSGEYFDMIQYSDAIKATVEVFKPQYMAGHSLGGASICFYFGNHDTPSFEKIILLGVPSELRHMALRFKNILGLSDRTIQNFDSCFSNNYHMSIDDISAVQFCEKIQVPTLVIHDKKDDIAKVKDALLYNKVLRHSELMLTEGLGHSLQDQKVFDRIINFLKKSVHVG